MDLSKRIEENLLNYVSIPTHTGTDLERNNKEFFEKWFKDVKYLNNNRENCGFFPIKDDYLGREIPWALLKGEGEDTIVMIHHTDTVDTDDYGIYKEYAYYPYEIEKILKEGKIKINKSTKLDLDSDKWMFGRAVADMKGGGSMHLSIFEEYSQNPDFKGNLLIMGLPDEENLSAGMRSAVYLLKELKDKHNLNYILMLNGEPQERMDEKKISIYDGSIGKVMPIFLVRGKLAHVGQIYLGLNPINLLSEIVRRTELNTNFIEKAGNTVTPPSTWLYFKDRKEIYDVSLPLYAGGYMSILPLKRSPMNIMEELKEISIDAFEKVINDMEESYSYYRSLSSMDYGDMEWAPKVEFYGDIYERVMKENPEFKTELDSYILDLRDKINKNEITRVEACYKIMEKTLERYSDRDPMVVIALAPPYYPSTNNSDLENYENMNNLIEDLKVFSKEAINIELEVQNYYTGISDLSYAMFTDNDETINYIQKNMLLWGKTYSIPLDLIKEMSMPVLNIGPWGKDFHKYSERVLKEDLFYNSPLLTKYVIDKLLK